MTKQDFENFLLKLDSPVSSKTRQFFTKNILKQWCFSNYYKYYIMNISKNPKFITITTCYEDDLNWLLSLKTLPRAVRSIVKNELECFKKKNVEVLKQEIKEQEKKQPVGFTFHGDIHGEQVNIGNFETAPTFSASGSNGDDSTKKRTHDAIENDDWTLSSNKKMNGTSLERDNLATSSSCPSDTIPTAFIMSSSEPFGPVYCGNRRNNTHITYSTSRKRNIISGNSRNVKDKGKKKADIRVESQIDISEDGSDINQEQESEEEEPEIIDNDHVPKISRDIFDLDDEFITVTESQQLDMNEIIPSTATPTPSLPSPSITRALLFNWAFKLYLNNSVTIPASTLAVIRDYCQQSVATRLTKLSGDLLVGWSTASVDDDYRSALNLGLSLIVDVSDTKPSKMLLACLSDTQVQDIKSHVKKEREKMNKLPENILSIFKQAFELFSTSGKHDALLYLTKVELKELEEKEDSITLQFIEVLKYIVRNVEKWSADDNPTEVDWTHRLVSLLDILLRDSSLSIRMGEKASLATKVARQENELQFGNKEKAQSVIGRKIDVITEHDGLELSASEWKSFKAGASVVNKQHNKNLRVNACVLLQLSQLPYSNSNIDGGEAFNLGVLTMEWRGAEGDLISIRKVNEHYIACKIGRMYLPTSVDDVGDFYSTLESLLYWKEFHLKLQKLIKAPLARLKRLKRDSSYQTTRNEEEPSIFFTPTRGNTSI